MGVIIWGDVQKVVEKYAYFNQGVASRGKYSVSERGQKGVKKGRKHPFLVLFGDYCLGLCLKRFKKYADFNLGVPSRSKMGSKKGSKKGSFEG